jgi:predicted aldo/keto reductase-like oxidoreductase
MEYRKLGRTGLDVSAIGLGTEYLRGQPRETVVATIREAIERGVNYFDLVFSFPEYLDNLSVAFQGHRDCVVLTGHLGSGEKDGQYRKTRSLKKSETCFLGLLSRLGIDCVDVLVLHNCDRQNDYDKLMNPNGILGLAQRFRQEGKARFIGFSGHTAATALQAIESGHIDVLMFPISMAAHAAPGKQNLFKACVKRSVGLVAIKPYAGGKLLSKKRTVRVGRIMAGGAEAFKLKKLSPITPVQCLSYVLSQVGVSTTVPGCANPDQMAAALAYLDATEEERDFSAHLADFEQYIEGECVYCNHCLPCPAAIDVGRVMGLLDVAQQRLTDALQAAYDALPARASDCVQCDACVERCPFGVDVIARMEQAVELFGS